jgi:hypothetical protein
LIGVVQWFRVNLFTCSTIYEIKRGLYLRVEDVDESAYVDSLITHYRQLYLNQGRILYYYQLKNLRQGLSEVYRGERLSNQFTSVLSSIFGERNR